MNCGKRIPKANLGQNLVAPIFNTASKKAVLIVSNFNTLDCEQSLRMVTQGRKSSEASESRGEAGEEAGKEGGTWEFNLGGTLEEHRGKTQCA